jgi:subtilisin family serine protease
MSSLALPLQDLKIASRPIKNLKRRLSMPEKPTQQYVVLPARGLRAITRASSSETRSFLQSFPDSPEKTGVMAKMKALPNTSQAKVKMLDAIAEDGAKLIEATPESILALREQQPELRIVPVRFYRRQVLPPKSVSSNVMAKAMGPKIKLTVVSQKDGQPVAGATIVAFTNYAKGQGAERVTNSKGEVNLPFGSMSKKLDRLYIYPQRNFWGMFKKNVTITNGQRVKLQPVDLSFIDSLRHFYGNSPDNAGTGVKVGVVDDGIDLNHADLLVSGGLNAVQGEKPNDFGDSGGGHGTHVGGIIAARGTPPHGIRGLAPACELRSYRVFGQGSEEASNFDIAKAIDRAVMDGCDLINMSLGGGDPDPVLRAAMEDALAAGSLVFVAAGNEDRSPVGFPASASPPAIAVSAMGRKNTFPSGVTQAETVAAPFGKDKKNFIASFSNFGMEIDLTAPGVGIISTFPGGYAPLDGTSMACPAAVGFAAKLLAGMQSILTMTRDSSRSNAMAQAVFKSTRKLGFGPDFEGQGMLV